MVFRETDSRYDCCFGIDPRPLGHQYGNLYGLSAQRRYRQHCGNLWSGVASVIIIILISKVLEKFRSNKYVEYAFYGLRPAVMGLIAAAGFGVLIGALFHSAALSDLTLSNFGSYIGIEECILFVVLLFATNKWKSTRFFISC